MQKEGKNKSVPPQRSPRSIFTDFCKYCSLHGFYYFYKSSNAFVRFVWSVIILSSVVLCGYLSWMIFQKFVVDPTLTVVESSNYPISKIPFPAVTICDPDMVYGPSTENITKMLVYRGYNSTQISEFYRSFTEVKEKGYNPAPYVKKMHDMFEDLGYSLNTLLDLLKKPCEALLVTCVWRSKEHDCSSMFRQEFLISGYCCQFDMNYFRRFADSATTFITGVQITEALDVIVDGRRFPPGENASEGHVLAYCMIPRFTNGDVFLQTLALLVYAEGKLATRLIVNISTLMVIWTIIKHKLDKSLYFSNQLYLFDQDDIITFLHNSVTVTPSSHFDINVDVWTIDSSDYVKALSVKSRKCILQSDATYGAGSYHGCMVQHIMRRVVETCNCIPFHYTPNELGVDVKKPCTWERLICIYENIDKVLGNMRSVIADSECYQRCDYVQYETEVKQMRQQRQVDGLNQGFSRIIVHFVKSTCLKYRREVLYTWDQVLANMGGIFGLCLGGSIISIIELAWFLFDMLFAVVRNCFKKKVPPKNQRQQEFVTEMAKIDSKNIRGKYKFSR